MEMASQFRRTFETGHVPFSPTQRGRADDARDRNNTLTKTAFAWRMPT